MALEIASQTELPATTLTDVFTASGPTDLKSVVVCNRTAGLLTFRMSIAVSAEADALKQYVFYDMPVVPNDSFTSALDIGLQGADVVRFYGSAAGFSITLFRTKY